MRLVFMGTPDFAVPSLQRAARLADVVGVFTQPDRRQGRGLTLLPPPVKVAAAELGLPVFQPARLRDPAALKQLEELAPELIVVVAYAQILPRRVLELPRLGCVNVHASLLPAYRGGAPIHWAVINGETESGVTTMLMDCGLDTGGILLQAGTPIGENETAGELHDRLAVLGADLLEETLLKLQAGALTPRPQPEEGVTYARNLQKSDGELDWSQPARELHDRVRGLNPWPVAYTSHAGRTLRVWSTRVWAAGLPADRENLPPGSIVEVNECGIVLQTGEGALLLTEVQPASKRRMSALDYARGYRLQAGDCLGG